MTDKQRGALAATLCITAGGWAGLALCGAWMRDPSYVIAFSFLAMLFAGWGCYTWSANP